MDDGLLDVSRLNDPVYVGQAMMRGQIARLTPAHLHTLYNEEVCDMLRVAMQKDRDDMDAAVARVTRSRNIIFALVLVHLTIGIGLTALAWVQV